MTVTQEDIEQALHALGLDKKSHVLVHSSYKAFGGVEGGPLAIVHALVETVATVMMPASTWERTTAWDAGGRFEGNAYWQLPPMKSPSEPFGYETPVDRAIGIIPETFRRAYRVCRSGHPLQSFIAHGELARFLIGDGDDAHDITPIRRLMEANGHVLLAGVTHTRSTAVHVAEHLAGRRVFIRHALTADGTTAVLSAGDSSGFDELQPHVEHLERRTQAGCATFRCYRLRPYVEAARCLIVREPSALLCECERCRATARTPLIP